MKSLKLITFALVLCSFQCGCSSLFPCEDRIESESRSPNQKYLATLLVRNCGATTDFSTIVKLDAESWIPIGNKNNVFVVNGDPDVRIEWQDDTTLKITCATCQADQTFKNEGAWRDVKILY